MAFHMWWTCELVQPFGERAFKEISKITNQDVQRNPCLGLLTIFRDIQIITQGTYHFSLGCGTITYSKKIGKDLITYTSHNVNRMYGQSLFQIN